MVRQRVGCNTDVRERQGSLLTASLTASALFVGSLHYFGFDFDTRSHLTLAIHLIASTCDDAGQCGGRSSSAGANRPITGSCCTASGQTCTRSDDYYW